MKTWEISRGKFLCSISRFMSGNRIHKFSERGINLGNFVIQTFMKNWEISMGKFNVRFYERF